MKYFQILLIIGVIILISTHPIDSPIRQVVSEEPVEPQLDTRIVTAASESGNSLDATLSFDRVITGQELSLLNSYTNTTRHDAVLNLSDLHISGWTLSKVRIDIASIRAAVEKEVVGIAYQNFNFAIMEALGTFYSKLAQGFYNQPYDGSLVNYSIYYSTSYYNSTLRGNASFVINSDYQTDSAMTTPMNMTGSDSAFTWVTIPGEDIILSANSVYWAIIDGSSLIKAGSPIERYPIIYWGAEDAAGAFGSYQHGTTAWDLKILEALMKYSYIPWNQSSNSPMHYFSPSQIDLAVNASEISQSSFAFSSEGNDLDSLHFESNQSVYLDYNITASYTQNAQSKTSWEIQTSGGIVNWNATIDLSYPMVSGELSRYLDVSKPLTWNIIGLYNSTNPTTNYDHYSIIDSTVSCGEMTNGNWMLRATSFNHLKELHLYDSSDNHEITAISILANLDVNITIREQDNDPVTTGQASLTASKGGTKVWSPSNESITDGRAYYPWDIDTIVSDNGLYRLEVVWTNGTDAGFRSQDVVVYYPTSLVASEYQLDGYTDSSLQIRVFLENTFNSQGLDGGSANVVYSFDGESNTSLTDFSNGTWVATISTAGKASGSYSIVVYAQGYAIENQSIVINANLIHDTELLAIQWSNTDNISFVDRTDLYVGYYRIGGTPIVNAIVNVTIDGNTLQLFWDNDLSLYRITFNGTDALSGFDTYNLFIQASKPGYKSQADNSQSLTIHEEITELSIEWTHGTNITYVEFSVLKANYSMSNGTAIPLASVTVTDGTTVWFLQWNATDGTYWIMFNGTDSNPGFGTHPLTIQAIKSGYKSQENDSYSITLRKETTTLSVELLPSSTVTYTSTCWLSIRYLMNNNGSAITDAMIIVTFAGIPRQVEWNSTTQSFYLLIDGDVDLAVLGTYSIVVEASRYGFDSASNSSLEIVLSKETTYLSAHWANGVNNPTFFSYTYLIVEYTYGTGISIMDATVNVTIDSYTWKLVWNSTEGYYQLRFNGSDSNPGVGTHSLTIMAWKYGFIDQVHVESVTIPVIPTLLSLEWTNEDTITYVEQTTLQAFFRMYNETPFANPAAAVVNVTVNGVTLPLVWNSISHAYERTFFGNDGSLDFASYSIAVMASLMNFQSQTNSSEVLTKQLEPTSIVINWIDGDNITYFDETLLSVRYLMSNGSPISTGVLNATINEQVWSLIWNASSSAYEAIIQGNDSRLHYGSFPVEIDASSFGFISRTETYENITIRLEDTNISFKWIPGNTISYLSTAVLRIYYRYLNGTPVLNAVVNATEETTWPAIYNSSSGAYEIVFTGSTFSTQTDVLHTLLILASKGNHVAQSDDSQTITILKEDTVLQAHWLNGDNTITYVESATIYINYSIAASGSVIVDAFVTVRIGINTWAAWYNETLGLFMFVFDGNMDPPGLGSFSLYISATYLIDNNIKDASDNSQTLTILSESVSIQSYWMGGNGTITYVESAILVVNYAMSNGTAISQAIVNVTIDSHLWNLAWDEASQTYRMAFNGSNTLPGLGYHELDIRAGREGFQSISNGTLRLDIVLEPTTLTPRWSNPNQDNITYFEYTYLFIEYSMSNGSVIPDASVNVTIDLLELSLHWNTTEGAYGIRFNGSDSLPGFGVHALTITASRYGFALSQNFTQTLEVERDPTTIQVNWSDGNDISYIESTTLMVLYMMSNSSPVPSAVVYASIGNSSWLLSWNDTVQAYCSTFAGDMNPPSLGNFTINIEASGDVYATRYASTSLTMREEATSAIASWVSTTLDWTQSAILEVAYLDSHGHLIVDASMKKITVDGAPYALKGMDGLYWFELNNTFDLGYHSITVNISKYGYEFATNSSVSFEIIKAPTNLQLDWNATTIDYLGQATLSANYSYAATGDIVPQTGVIANITIDGGSPIPLIQSGDFWVISLTGIYLDLGSHSVVVKAQAYGYEFSQAYEILTVNEVLTDALSISWIPSNLTIEYTDSFVVTAEYTYYGGDVPDNATIIMTIDGHNYALVYSAGEWSTSVLGEQIGIGIFDASFSAHLYGYRTQTDTTIGLNITPAANMFLVSWQPTSLRPSYIDIINVSVIYLQNYNPIEDASVNLLVNGTIHELTYNSVDKKWHLSIRATAIGLGIWNVTVTANKTGYENGRFSSILTISTASTELNMTVFYPVFYYDEEAVVNISYQMSNSSIVPDATLILSIDGFEQSVVWDTNHWTTTLDGGLLGTGKHNLTVIVSAYGFVDQYNTSSLAVLPIPTYVMYNPINVVYAREDIILKLSYLDNRTGFGVLEAQYMLNWTESINLVDISNGTFLLHIDGNSLHVGEYAIEILLHRTGYTNGSAVFEILVNPLPTELALVSQITQYENETITIEARFLDTANFVPIEWAVVIASINEEQYFLLYNAVTHNYTISFHLPFSMSPGTHSLSISAHATDCDAKEGVIQLNVLKKSTPELTLDVVDEIDSGGELSIFALMRIDGQAAPNVMLTLFISIIAQNNNRMLTETIYTNNTGVATFIFSVPSDAEALEITVKFSGSISSWSMESEVSDVRVVADGVGLVDMFLQNSILLAIAIGGISIPAIGITVLKRKRGVSKPVDIAVGTITSPDVPEMPTMAKPIDQLKIIISEGKLGFTRSEISERLDISPAKTNALVKELLSSDASFYEVREGTKRIIMKKK